MRFLIMLLLSALLHAEPVKVGFGVHKPPYIDEPNRSGLELELVRAAFQAVDVEIEPVFMPQERLHALLRAKAMPVITTTNENSGIEAHYSDVYISYQNYAISLAERGLQLNQLSDLSRYSVTAFQRAKTILGPEFKAAVEQSPSYIEEGQQIVRNLLLFSRRVDVAIGDRRIFEHFNREVRIRVDSSQPLSYHPLFPPTPYKAAFLSPELRDRFNRGLALIRKNGVYAAIEKRYDSK